MSPELKAMKSAVTEYLKKIYDPEIPVNIYDLGLIYDVDLFVKKGQVNCYILMTLTTPGCSVADLIVEQVSNTDKVIEGIDHLQVDLTFDPPWTQDKLSDEAKLELGLL